MSKTLAQLFMIFAFLLCVLSAARAGYAQKEIVGMSIACSNDKVYTWYSDRTVSVGTSENLAAYEPPHPYKLPFGKTPADIVEIGIASTDNVYVWYKDRTVSSGTSTDLDKYQPRHPYRLPIRPSIGNIVGMDIACTTDHVYVWYSSGHVSAGTSDQLDKFIQPGGFGNFEFLKKPLVGIGIARNDHVYYWYGDKTGSSGTSRSVHTYIPTFNYILGPGPCDISADPPKISGRVVFSVGIRGPTCTSLTEVVVRLRTNDTRIDRKILSERRGTGGNFETPITYSCMGRGELKVFTEIEKAGRLVRSAESSIPGCFLIPGDVK